jgi:hypothetical protein
MSGSIYFYNGKFYIPSQVQTDVGYYLSTEPVTVLDATDTEGLQSAVRDMITHRTPIVPAPPKNDIPKPFLHKYAKAKSWKTFENNCQYWELGKAKDRFVFNGLEKVPGGWDFVSEKDVILGPASDLDTVISNAIAHIQESIKSTSQ